MILLLFYLLLDHAFGQLLTFQGFRFSQSAGIQNVDVSFSFTVGGVNITNTNQYPSAWGVSIATTVCCITSFVTGGCRLNFDTNTGLWSTGSIPSGLAYGATSTFTMTLNSWTTANYDNCPETFSNDGSFVTSATSGPVMQGVAPLPLTSAPTFSFACNTIDSPCNNTITVNWVNTPGTTNGYPNTGFLLVWSTDLSFNNILVARAASSGTAVNGGPFSANITGLSAGVSYNIAVIAMNRFSNGTRSPYDTRISGSRPWIPSIPVVTVASLSSLNISWVNGPTGGLAITQYDFTCSNNNFLAGSILSMQGTTPSPFTFTNLLVTGQRYQCRMSATNAYGTSGTTNYAPTGTLLATIPDAPTALATSPFNTTALRLSWNAPNSNGDAITVYTVSWSTTASNFGAGTLQATAASTSLIVGGLLPAGDYVFRVAANNSVGQGPWSNSVSSQQPAVATIDQGSLRFVGSSPTGNPSNLVASTTGAASVLFTGQRFLTYAFAGASDVTVFFGTGGSLSYQCVVTSVNDTAIQCDLPAGVGAGLTFVVTSGSTSTIRSVDTFTYGAPTITAGTLTRGDRIHKNPLPSISANSEVVYFSGTNFGTNPSLVQVTYGDVSPFNNYTCSVVSVSNTEIACSTAQPANIRVNLRFRVSVGGGGAFSQIASGTDVYNYPTTPNVTSITGGCATNCGNGVCDCPTAGGVNITINGQNLYEPQVVTVRGAACTPVYYISGSQIACRLPEGTGLSQTVLLTQNPFVSNAINLISYARPSLFQVIGCSPLAPCSRTAANENITVTGANFGLSSATVLVGGRSCGYVEHISSNPHGRLLCTIPQGSGTGIRITVIQTGGLASLNTNVSISYIACGPGTYINDTDCTDCNPGYFSAGATLFCSACKAGTNASSFGASNCGDCPVGRYSNANSSLCFDCEAGFFTVLPASGACEKCPLGRFKNASSNQPCDACPAGTFQDSTGQLSCRNCPAGTYSPAGSPNCLPCDSGYYSAAAAPNCTACSAGYFSVKLPSDTVGPTECTGCPMGTYTDEEGLSYCKPCDSGNYTDTVNSTRCLPCDAGKFSVRISNNVGPMTCDNCTAGRFSPGGLSYCSACPSGRFGAHEGQNFCEQCPSSAVSVLIDDADPPTNCTECPAGEGPDQLQALCVGCTLGKFRPAGSSGDCQLCPPGFYQDEERKASCKPCEVGTFASGNGTVTCTKCPIGSHASVQNSTFCPRCSEGSFSNIEGTETCSLCEGGKYADLDGATFCRDCPKGQISAEGSYNCTECLPGYFNNVTAGEECFPCARGYFAKSGDSRCTACPAGTFSLDYAGSCSGCPNGTFALDLGSSACENCTRGSTSVAGSQRCSLCSEGRYAATDGYSFGECAQCLPGKYQARSNSTDCSACPEGKYSVIAGANLCEDCAPGFYIPLGGNASAPCLPCPGNTYTDLSGQYNCQPCNDGQVVNRGRTGCVDTYLQDAAVKYTFLVAGLGGVLFVLGNAIAWFLLRENRIINFSSPPFMYLAMLGHAMVFGSVILWVWDTEITICHFRNVLLNIGVNLMFVAIILKTWRLHRIFNRKKSDLKTVRISNFKLLSVLAVTLIFDGVILIVWYGVRPFSVDTLTRRCLSNAEPYVHAPLWAWKLAAGVFMMWLIVKVRHIDERFNESRWLEMALYNIVMVVVVLVVLTVALSDSMAPRLWFVMFATMLFYLTLSTFCLLFLPKYYRIYTSEHEYDDLYGSSVAEDVEEAEEVLDKEKKVETEEQTEKKKGVADMTDDEKLNKLYARRAKKSKELQKLLKIVERSKQRMKTDITALNNLSSNVLALQQEIEYRKNLMRKQGKVVNNQVEEQYGATDGGYASGGGDKPASDKADVELVEHNGSGDATDAAADKYAASVEDPDNDRL